MKVKEDQIFNLMDTNGRRNDVMDALQGYLVILNDILQNQTSSWDSMPESTAQFEFYRQAIALSPDVFQKHREYDRLMAELAQMPELKRAIEERDLDSLRRYYMDAPEEWRDNLDKNVEARARHYTSNLVKLGFASEARRITDVGELLLGKIPLHRDRIEALLPLNDTNILYLRQLLKLRIFDSAGKRYYSPFCMALYALLRRERISQGAFRALVQGLGPYHMVDDYDALIGAYEQGDFIWDDSSPVPEELNRPARIEERVFQKYFKNRKSGDRVRLYYRFYLAMADFLHSESENQLDRLLTLYEENRETLNKAFGCGNALFPHRRGIRPTVGAFLEMEDSGLFSGDFLPDTAEEPDLRHFHRVLYQRFQLSKTLDGIREYSDTTIRIFKASGLISFENGYAELVCRDLCQCVFDIEAIRSRIQGTLSQDRDPDSTYSDYHYYISYFRKNCSISAFLRYSDEKTDKILQSVRQTFGGAALAEIPRIVQRRRTSDFAAFIARRYPAERVKTLLEMFSDRANDRAIQNAVCPDASVPTIYEYVVGLAWYYFSDKTIDLLQSYRLTLSADFEPLTHAGGGMGDIVIDAPDQVILLEATLMNPNSQKRGEWEPVLRHAVNLKAAVESADRSTEADSADRRTAPREVTTFFIADSFDANTINIWKAISSVPLQSSTDRTRFTDRVLIMPVSTGELAHLMDHPREYRRIIQQVRTLFLKDIQQFNLNWRADFISQLL